MGRQHQGIDRPGVRQIPEGSGKQGKIEKTGCKIICGAPTTLAVKGLMMMVIVCNASPRARTHTHTHTHTYAHTHTHTHTHYQVCPLFSSLDCHNISQCFKGVPMPYVGEGGG